MYEMGSNALRMDWDGVKQAAQDGADEVIDVWAELPDRVTEKVESAKKTLEDGMNQFEFAGGASFADQALGMDDLEDNMKIIDEQFSALNKSMEETAGATKDAVVGITREMNAALSETMRQMTGISSSVSQLVGTTSHHSTAEYDRHLEEMEKRHQEHLEELNEQNNAFSISTQESDQLQSERLEEQLEKAIANNDALTANVIENELRKVKAMEATEKATAEKAAAEKKLEEDLANEKKKLEHEKSMSVWQGQVDSAESKKSAAIADATLGIAQTAMDVSLGIANQFGKSGIIGLTTATLASASLVPSSISGAAGIKSASAELDNVKANKPSVPSFAIGTSGYDLRSGTAAIVGENGPEIVRASGNRLEVESNFQSGLGSRGAGGMSVVVNIHAADMSPDQMRESVIDALKTVQQGDLGYVS